MHPPGISASRAGMAPQLDRPSFLPVDSPPLAVGGGRWRSRAGTGDGIFGDDDAAVSRDGLGGNHRWAGVCRCPRTKLRAMGQISEEALDAVVAQLRSVELRRRLASRGVLAEAEVGENPSPTPVAGARRWRRTKRWWRVLRECISAERRPGSPLVDLVVEHPERARAKHLVAALIDEFLVLVGGTARRRSAGSAGTTRINRRPRRRRSSTSSRAACSPPEMPPASMRVTTARHR